MMNNISPLALRKDGRRLLQPRRLHCQIGKLNSHYTSIHPTDSGAVLISQGNTRILAQVVDRRATRQAGTQPLIVDISWAPFATAERRLRPFNDRSSASQANIIQNAFENLILLPGGSNHNASGTADDQSNRNAYINKIIVQLTVLGCDGSCLSACINAVSLALIRAGIPLLEFPVAATSAYLEQKFIIDPMGNESLSADAELVIAILERTKGISVLLCDSKVKAEVFEQLITIATLECENVAVIIKETIREHLERLTLTSQVLSSKILQLHREQCAAEASNAMIVEDEEVL